MSESPSAENDAARYIADGYECADYAEFLRLVDGDQPIDTVTWVPDADCRLVVRWTPPTSVLPPGSSDA